MSNKNMESLDLGERDDTKKSELVGADGTKMEVEERDELRFIPHPNTVFAAPAKKKETKGGLILPEGYDRDESPTPIAKILAVGENVAKQFEETGFSLEKGDYVYVDAQFMRFGKIDGVKGLILMADGILGKLPVPNESN